MIFQDILKHIKDNFTKYIVFCILTTILGSFYYILNPKQYESKALIKLQPVKGDLYLFDSFIGSQFSERLISQNQRAIVVTSERNGELLDLRIRGLSTEDVNIKIDEIVISLNNAFSKYWKSDLDFYKNNLTQLNDLEKQFVSSTSTKKSELEKALVTKELFSIKLNKLEIERKLKELEFSNSQLLSISQLHQGQAIGFSLFRLSVIGLAFGVFLALLYSSISVFLKYLNK